MFPLSKLLSKIYIFCCLPTDSLYPVAEMLVSRMDQICLIDENIDHGKQCYIVKLICDDEVVVDVCSEMLAKSCCDYEHLIRDGKIEMPFSSSLVEQVVNIIHYGIEESPYLRNMESKCNCYHDEPLPIELFEVFLHIRNRYYTDPSYYADADIPCYKYQCATLSGMCKWLKRKHNNLPTSFVTKLSNECIDTIGQIINMQQRYGRAYEIPSEFKDIPIFVIVKLIQDEVNRDKYKPGSGNNAYILDTITYLIKICHLKDDGDVIEHILPYIPLTVLNNYMRIGLAKRYIDDLSFEVCLKHDIKNRTLCCSGYELSIHEDTGKSVTIACYWNDGKYINHSAKFTGDDLVMLREYMKLPECIIGIKWK